MEEMYWSRWGDPARAHGLPDDLAALVRDFFGEAPAAATVDPGEVTLSDPLPDGLAAELAGIVGAERVLTDRGSRLVRTRGKSTPDLLRIRQGDGSDAPGAVVRPAGHDEVQAVLEWCARRRVALVPFGGGTSVVGGLAPPRGGFAGVVSLDLQRLNRLVDVDAESHLATFEAGCRGPEAERLLGEHGLTLGHFPQSFRYASLGGFAATRSAGQSSAGYGRFDDLVVGLTAATPLGTLTLGRAPADAAGPDLRRLLLGSEGAFGVITRLRLRVRPRPESTAYAGWRFPHFAAGVAACRAVAQGGARPTVIRLSDETETGLNLAAPDALGGGPAAGGCLMVVGFEGEVAEVGARVDEATGLLTRLGGVDLGPAPGRSWVEGRFDAPYLRDSLLDAGVLVETLETATFWNDLPRLYDAVRAALTATLGERALVLTHVSHTYETGASLYLTVAAPMTENPVAQWREAKAAASDAILATGGTITHHHGVGTDHVPWLAEQLGPVGVEILRAVKQRLDPLGVLNPGVLVP